MLVPTTILFFYKILYPIDYTRLKNSKDPFPRSIEDRFLNVINSYCLLYYLIDSIAKIATGSYKTACGASFLFHHFVGLIYLPTVIFARHYPWFWLGPGFMHTYLLAFPHLKWLNYIYLGIIFLFQYGIYQKPFTNLKEYNPMKKGIIFIEISCFFLWYFNCSNAIVH